MEVWILGQRKQARIENSYRLPSKRIYCEMMGVKGLLKSRPIRSNSCISCVLPFMRLRFLINEITFLHFVKLRFLFSTYFTWPDEHLRTSLVEKGKFFVRTKCKEPCNSKKTKASWIFIKLKVAMDAQKACNVLSIEALFFTGRYFIGGAEFGSKQDRASNIGCCCF